MPVLVEQTALRVWITSPAALYGPIVFSSFQYTYFSAKARQAAILDLRSFYR